MLLAAHTVGSEQSDLVIFRVICMLVDGYTYVPRDYSDIRLDDVMWKSRK